MNRTLVIGGTGNIGSQVIAQLASANGTIRAMVRNPDAGDMPPPVELVGGDLTLPETLKNALQDVQNVFLVWTAAPEAAAPALELITRYARRIVYLSAPVKTQHPFFQASLPNPMSVLHEEIERLIVNSGIEYTFLRPGMLASNAIDWWAPQIRKSNLVRWPYLNAPTAPIDEFDIASVAVQTLLRNGHEGADYILTGPQSLSQFEQIAAIGQALGRNLQIEEISPEKAPEGWNSLWPSSIKNMLLKSWAAAIGQPAYVSNTVEEVTGNPARKYADWVKNHIDIFR